MKTNASRNGTLKITHYLWLKARPPKVWKAISSAKHLGRWYTTPKKLELKKGGRWDFVGFPGRVLAVKSGVKLVETHTFNKKERPSRMTFELEPAEKYTMLKLTHDGFGRNRNTYKCWKGAWSFVLCNLKSYIETGAPMWETCFKGKDEA